MQKLIEKTVTSGVAGAIFRPIFRFFGCMNDDHVEHISTGSYCVAVALELAACLFLFTGIDSLQGGLCCIKPNPTWAQTNETAVEHGPFGRACRTESHGVGFCKTGGFQCNGFNLDYSGASSTNADLSFAPGGFGQCRVKFPIYDTDRVGNCDPWTDKDSRKCWRQTYHIDSTQWSEYDTTEMCSQKGSERYIAEWKGGMTTLAKMKLWAFLVQSVSSKMAGANHHLLLPLEVWRLLNTLATLTNIVSLVVIAVLTDLCGEIYPGHPSYYIFAFFKERDRMAFMGKVRRPLTHRPPLTAHHSLLTARRVLS